MNKFKRRFLAFSSHLICFGLTLNLFYIWIRAYLSGNEIPVRVNTYGEVTLELILIPITLLFCLIGLMMAWKLIRKDILREVKDEVEKN